MPDAAFGNIWPQYQAGWRQRYAPPAGAAPVTVAQAPFVGQPIGAGDVPGPDTPPEEVEAQTASAPYLSTPVYDPTPYRQAIARLIPNLNQPTAAPNQSITLPTQQVVGQAQPAVPRAQPVTWADFMRNPAVAFGGGLIHDPTTGFWVNPAAAAAYPNAYSGGASGGGYYSPSGGYVGASPGPGQSGYIYPNAANAYAAGDTRTGTEAQPGLGQRLLQTLGHFFTGTLGQNPPYVGQPLGGWGSYGSYNQNQPQRRPQQPQSPSSELSNQPGQQDTSMLAASGGGEPQTRYNMGPFNPQLTNIGGFTAAGGTGGSGLAPIESLLGSITGQMSQSGQGGGATGLANQAYGGGSTAPSGMTMIGSGGGGGGAGTLGGGMSGATGLSGEQLGTDVASMFMALGKLYQQANAPVGVNPAGWANAPPQPAQFSWPSLSPNTGGVLW